ncbi:MAG: hypothetical protein QXT38_04135 [Candidatus Aenigmatarchaeota archaeon]
MSVKFYKCELCGQSDFRQWEVVAEFKGLKGKPAGYVWKLCTNCYRNRHRYDLNYPQDLGIYVSGMDISIFDEETQREIEKIKARYEEKG